MSNMNISACVITYNQENYIKKCLEGAINQKTSYSYEIIIGDDCSTDNTRRICEEYSNKYPGLIKLLPKEPNLGMIANWIRTMSNCRGEYISICEGDDYWTDPYKLQKQANFLEANPNTVLCAHSIFMDIKGLICYDVFRKKYKNVCFFNKEDFKNGNPIATVSTMFRNNIPVFSIQNCLKKDYLCGDIPLWLELAEYGNFAILPNRMAVYRDGVGIMSQMKQSELANFLDNIYKKHNIILNKKPNKNRFLIKLTILYCYIMSKIKFDLIKSENNKSFNEN